MDAKTDLLIAELLAESRSAHQQYREQSAAMVSDGAGGLRPNAGNPIEARQHLSRASARRQAAESLDAAFESSAWLTEPATHDHAALTLFYADQLARDVPVPMSVETLRALAAREQFLPAIGPDSTPAAVPPSA